MTKSKKIYFTALFIAIFAIAAISFVFTQDNKFQILAEVNTESVIENYYNNGFVFEAPKGKIISANGEVEADGTFLYYPDGSIRQSDKYTLFQNGDYKLIYFKKGTPYLTAEKTFCVKDMLFGTSSSASSSAYSENLILSSSQKGISVSVADGDEFKFNKPIDLSLNNNRQDLVSVAFYNLSINAEKSGYTYENTVQTDKVIFKIVDCYDDNNYIEVQINYLDNGLGLLYPYARAGLSCGISAGLHPDDKNTIEVTSSNRKEIFIDGHRYIARINSSGTTLAREGVNVPTNYYKIKNVVYSLAYEPKTNMVYVRQQYLYAKPSDPDNWLKADFYTLICDMDDENIFGEDAFKGFSNGEVNVSIKGLSYEESLMNMEVLSFGEMSGEELKNIPLNDEKPPVINLNLGSLENSGICVLKDKPFTLPVPTVYDINLKSVNCSVYFNYKTESEFRINVKDNVIIPSMVGCYTVVYEAIDGYGNKTIKEISLNCPLLDVSQTINFSTEKITKLEAGKICYLPSYSVSSMNNDDVRVDIYIENSGESQKLSSENHSFIPLNKAIYKIKYIYYDKFESGEFSYEIESSYSNAVIMDNELLLPEYFIKNANYSFDKYFARTFAENNFGEQLCDLYVKVNDGDYQLIDYDKYTITAEDGDLLYFKAKYEEFEKVSKGYKVVDVNFKKNLDMRKYFYGDFVKESSYDEIVFTSKKTSGNDKLDFINVVSLNNFKLEFCIPQDKANFGSLIINVTDFYDRTKKMSLIYSKYTKTVDILDENNSNSVIGTKDVDMLAISSNESTQQRLSQTEFAGQKFTVLYNSASNVFLHKIDASLRTFADKIDFTSDKILVSFELIDIKGTSGISVSYFNNQQIMKATKEFATPQINVFKSSGYHKLNEIVKIGTLWTTDVLSPICNEDISVKVIDPEKKFVSSIDGVLLNGSNKIENRDYEIKLSLLGEYIITYTTKDQHGNESPDLVYKIIVTDVTAPIIKIENNYNENTLLSVKAGDKIKVKSYTLEDDWPIEEITVLCSVINPLGEMELLSDNVFETNLKGEYKIIYYAFDKAGNYACSYYRVLAE